MRGTDSPDTVELLGPLIGDPRKNGNTEVSAQTHGHKWQRLTLPINRQ